MMQVYGTKHQTANISFILANCELSGYLLNTILKPDWKLEREETDREVTGTNIGHGTRRNKIHGVEKLHLSLSVGFCVGR